MTVDELLAKARFIIATSPRVYDGHDAQLARGVIELLSHERADGPVTLPRANAVTLTTDARTFVSVNSPGLMRPDEARLLAVELQRAADEAERGER